MYNHLKKVRIPIKGDHHHLGGQYENRLSGHDLTFQSADCSDHQDQDPHHHHQFLKMLLCKIALFGKICDWCGVMNGGGRRGGVV